MLINVSDDAAHKIVDFIEDAEKQRLRIKVVGGGCSGLRYDLAIDEELNEDADVILNYDTFQVVVDEKTALYVQGSSLNYVDTIMESGFKIENPNARNTCGCGESFYA